MDDHMPYPTKGKQLGLLAKAEAKAVASHWQYWLIRGLRSPRRSLLVIKKWARDSRELRLSPRVWWDYVGIHLQMHSYLHRFPSLIEPIGLNDKIQWLKLFDRDPIQILFIDKIKVRAWVAAAIGEQYLVPLRAVADQVDDFNEDVFVKPYVMKANHDSGSTVVVRRPGEAENAAARNKVSQALRNRYGVVSSEWGYRYVEPRAMVEELLPGDEDHSLADYKFYCSQGEVLWLQVVWDRQVQTREAIYEPDGTPTGFHLDATMRPGVFPGLPDTLAEMTAIAEQLSAQRPFVRVDLYSIDGHVFFGELTNWPQSGYYPTPDERILGERLQLPLELAVRRASRRETDS